MTQETSLKDSGFEKTQSKFNKERQNAKTEL